MTEGLTRGRGEGMSAAAREASPREAVLAANWTGGSTVPSRRQYPHQWGWDAAYIAIGWSWVDPARAAAELESLLRGQWPDGRVPHIVFHPEVPEDAYFPGPGVLGSDAASDGVATSGLTQPPLHARAALEVAQRTPDGDAASAFLRRVFARLAAQHAYLAGRRDAGGGGLAAIVHPWESGLDDSPAWDAPLAAVELPAEGVEPYERRDRDHVDAARAAERRRLRPLRAPGARVPGQRVRRRRRAAHVPGRGPAVQRDLAVVDARAGGDRGAGSARTPGRTARPRRGIHAALMSAAVGRRAALPRRSICARGRLARPPHGALARAAARSRPAGRGGARRSPPSSGSPHFRSAGRARASRPPTSSPRSSSRRRYWRGPIWANLNWLLEPRPAPAGLRRRRPTELERTHAGPGRGLRHARVLRPADRRRARCARLLVDRGRRHRHPPRRRLSHGRDPVRERVEALRRRVRGRQGPVAGDRATGSS